MSKLDWLKFPVVSTGSEYLVIGKLIRQKKLTYLTPEDNEGHYLDKII
jgi:hypothetical protein